jgi:hypothetical protein
MAYFTTFRAAQFATIMYSFVTTLYATEFSAFDATQLAANIPTK